MTAALNDLSAAQEARVDFLESAYATNEDVEAATVAAGQEPTADEIDTAVGTVYTNSINAVNLGTTGTVGDIDSARSDAYNNAIIDEQKTVNAKAVSDAKDDVSEVEGLSAAVKSLQAAQGAYETAVEAEVETKATLDGALAAVNTANNAAGYTLAAPIPTEPTTPGTPEAVVVDGATQVIGFNASGELEIASAYADDKRIDELFAAVQGEVNSLVEIDNAVESLESSVAQIVVLEAGNELDGTETTTYYDTDQKQAVAGTVEGLFTDADGNLYVAIEGAADGTFGAQDTLHVVSDIAVTAETDGTLSVEYSIDESAADFTIGTDAQVGDFTAVDATNTITFTSSDLDASNYVDTGSAATGYLDVEGVTDNIDFSADAPLAYELISAQKTEADFNEAVEDYVAAKELAETLEGLEDAVTEARSAIEDSEADGGLGVTLRDGADNFTVESDVYLYSEDAGNQNLSNFGNNGEDKIYFGTEFSLTEIPAGDTIADNVGDVAAKEVLWDQQGSNLVLYVENETFAGNASQQTDMVQITLTGVSADEVSFVDGYLTAGEVA